MGFLKRWEKELKRIIIAVALAAAACSLYHTWINPPTTSLWFPYTFSRAKSSSPSPLPLPSPFQRSEFSNSDAPAPAPAPVRATSAESILDDNGTPSMANYTANSGVEMANRSTTDKSENPLQRNSSKQANSENSGVEMVKPSTTDKSEDSFQRNSNKGANYSANSGIEMANRSTTDKSENSFQRNSNKGPSRSKGYDDFVERNQELLLAKKEIENSWGVVDDPDLYGPLYHNVSKFKKSYDLMEKIFKVYIYREGQRPYFHTAALKGIYASEGWFMKLISGNKQFVVTDPRKAHMFYLPYSVYEIVEGMYVPNSRNMHPLQLFLRDYVNMIAAKYPFWNRTRGADHFFVACHDWGPYTTREHPELMKNAVKALCNADLSEGYFVLGKDVSLPETNLHSVRQPPKHLGGNSASMRSILAFFAGNMHGRVRPVLLEYWKDKDDDMKIYELLPARVAKKMSYAQHMKSSKYCICPMGYEVNSPRIVEAIYYECVPVIIADNFVHPLNEVLNWNAFSITVAEKDIPKLKDILLNISERRYRSMQLRVKKVQKHFIWHRNPLRYDIFHMILHSIWLNRLNQIETLETMG